MSSRLGDTNRSVSIFGRMMLVDDEPDVLGATKKIIETAFQGVKVDAFTDSRVALEQLGLHSSEYQLLLSDVRMPDVTGFVLAREAKRLNPKITVLLTSAFEVMPSEFASVMPSTHVDGFLLKPVRKAVLIEAITKNINPTC